jgi:hypothetical protein
MDREIFYRVRDKLISRFEQSIDEHMAGHPAQAFFLWSFSAENPEREMWLHFIGISQLVQLTMQLLEGLVAGPDYERLLHYSLPMNVYQLYEIVSDNLCIGLGSALAHDNTRGLRQEVLAAFNQAMVARLRGDARPAREVLAPVRTRAQQLSARQQTLSADKFTAVALRYAQLHGAASMADIDGAVWPLLVANIETCQQLAHGMAGYCMGPMVTRGLINRYAAVSALLDEPDMFLLRRVVTSTDAILVVPTLAYYISVLKEAMGPAEGVAEVVGEGLMGEALFTTAVLVRLLNDLGTPLLVDDKERAALLHSLAGCSESDVEHSTISRLLLAHAEQHGAALTRLRKDIEHGELNICLFGLSELPVARAVRYFGQRLEQLAALYAQSHTYLSSLCTQLTERLRDDRPQRLIYRFVRFHERLYSQPYTEATGEYTG